MPTSRSSNNSWIAIRPLVAVALLAGAALSGSVATAQTQPTPTPGTDLVIIQAYIANGPDGKQTDQPIVGNAAKVHLILTNQGSQQFASTSPWQVSWALNVNENTQQCPYNSPSDQTTSCKRIYTALNGSINPGGVLDVAFDWIPTGGFNGSRTIFTSIDAVSSTGSTSAGPDSKTDNNVKTFSTFIRLLGVQAVPDRQKAPSAATVNDEWPAADIKDDCPTTTVSQVGCKVQPGGIVKFRYNVKNEGNTADSYYGTIFDPSGPNSVQNLTARGWKFVFAPQNFSLDEGASQTVELQILVPPGEKSFLGNGTNVPGANITGAKVTWSSRLDPSKTSQSPPGCTDPDSGLCKDPEFPSLLIGIKHGLTINSTELTRIANVSEPVTFNVTLHNAGNAEDTFVLHLDNDTAQINTSWKYDFPWNVVVPAFSNQTITLKINDPPRQNATKGPHAFNVTFQSLVDPDGKTLQTLHFVADVQQRFAVSASLDTGLVRVYPDQKAGYVMRIHNDGNGLDNVTLRLANVPFQWDVSLSQTTVPIPGFSTALVYLNATPAPNTVENYNATFFINGSSQGPANLPPDLRSGFSLPAQMNVQKGPNIRVTSDFPSTFVDPGATSNFTLTLKNTGNLRDTFHVGVNRTQDQFAWSVVATPTELTLDPLQTGTVNVALTAPSGGAVGETTSVLATVTASYDAGIFNQTTLLGQVSGPDLHADSILTNSTDPYAGDVLGVSVVLGNAGNKAPDRSTTLRLYFVQEGVPIPIATRTYQPSELAGGRQLTETFDFDTATACGAQPCSGSGVLLAALDEGAVIAEIHESNNNATRPLTIRTFNILVTAAQGLSGIPGEKLSYSEIPNVFLVTYNGNQPTEPVDIVLTSEHGWLGTGESEQRPPGIALPRGTPIQILADVTIPTDPQAAHDTLKLSIIPQLRPTAVVSSTTVTSVIDTDLPQISAVGATPDVAVLGTPVTIHATVKDTTGLASVRAFIVRPDNVTDTVALEPAADHAFTASQPFTIAGSYRLYVEAVDASDNANKNTSRDVVNTFTVRPGSAPVIALAGAQSTTVRTGSFIRFNITDPLGIKDASYSIKGISYDMGKFPYQIDTSSFTDGTIDLVVTAHNIYGVASSQNFTIVVDNTPPGIKSVTLDPPNPKANQDVTLRITTDPKVETVQVLIKKDGQVLDTRNAVKKGSGVFELLLNPGEGSYTIDVTAKDAAGNTKLQAGAVSFTAKPGSPFNVPAPGVGLLLVALGVSGVLMRRRP